MIPYFEFFKKKSNIYQSWNVYLQLYTQRRKDIHRPSLLDTVHCAQASLSSLFTGQHSQFWLSLYRLQSLQWCSVLPLTLLHRADHDHHTHLRWTAPVLQCASWMQCYHWYFCFFSEPPFRRLGPFFSQFFKSPSTSASVALRDLVFPRTASTKVVITNLNTLI